MAFSSRAALFALIVSVAPLPVLAVDPPAPMVPLLVKTSEIVDREDAAKFLPTPVVVEKLATGMKFTEGPVWMPAQTKVDATGPAMPEGYLLFSDIPVNQIKKWTAKEGLTVFRELSNGTNGNARDSEGRLISCEHATRRVTRTEPDGTITVLADAFEGKKFNSPNDVAVHSSGALYFTDPPYGLPKGEKKEQATNNVYRVDPKTKEVKAVATDFDMPNGLAFSPDYKTLYVADSGKPKHIRALAVNADGTLGAGTVFSKIDKGAPDGIKVDPEGRVFSSSGDGAQVFSPKGELVARILIPEAAANLAFGGANGRDLYITAKTSLYRVALKPLTAAEAGGRARHVALINDMIAAMNSLTTELKSVKDEATSKAAAPKVQAAGAQLQALKNQADKLPPLGNGEDQRLQEEFSKPLTEAMTAFTTEAMRVAAKPELLTPELKGAFESLSQLK